MDASNLTPTSTTALRIPLRDKRATLMYMRDVTLMVVSEIAWSRGMCPKTEFKEVDLFGIKANILKNTDNVIVKYFMQNMAGAFEAMNREYLKSLTLNVKDRSGCFLIESYTLSYKYDGSNPPLSYSSNSSLSGCGESPECLKSTTDILFRLKDTMTCLQELPNETVLYFQLTYYECAPDDFLSSGFRPLTEEEKQEKKLFRDSLLKVRQGKLESTHGQMTCHTALSKSILNNEEIDTSNATDPSLQ